MRQKDKKFSFVASFENVSIIRKFSILFLLGSVIPLVVLYYIFAHHGNIGINTIHFKVTLILIALGVFISYISIRSLLKKIIAISEKNRAILDHLSSPESPQEYDKEENEIVVLSRSFSAVTKRLEENVHSLQLAKQTLHTLMSKMAQGISNMDNIDIFLDLILESTTSALGARVGAVLLLNEQKTELVIHAVNRAPFDVKKKTCIKLNPTLQDVIKQKQPKVISGILLHQKPGHPLNPLFEENVLCVPLVNRDSVSGMMTFSKASDEEFSREDENLLFKLASQTAIALENAKLNQDIEKTYFETLSALALAIDTKDEFARGHIERVGQIAERIGQALGLDDEDLDVLKKAARLHDLGKLGIPDAIIRKKGPLNDEEWVIMRRHPEIGESIIKPIRSLAPLRDMIRHHHEKIDGSGYPDGLKGDEITPLVRILSVADVYDALTTERPYRAKMSPQDAISLMRTMKNHLDQDIIDVLVNSLESIA